MISSATSQRVHGERAEATISLLESSFPPARRASRQRSLTLRCALSRVRRSDYYAAFTIVARVLAPKLGFCAETAAIRAIHRTALDAVDSLATVCHLRSPREIVFFRCISRDFQGNITLEEEALYSLLHRLRALREVVPYVSLPAEFEKLRDMGRTTPTPADLASQVERSLTELVGAVIALQPLGDAAAAASLRRQQRLQQAPPPHPALPDRPGPRRAAVLPAAARPGENRPLARRRPGQRRRLRVASHAAAVRVQLS